VWLPPGIQSGLHADGTDLDTGLLHVGEGWAEVDQPIAWHHHPVWELYLQLHGGATWEVGGRTLQLSPGWLLAVPAGVPHRGRGRPGRGAGRHHFAYAAVDLELLGRRLPEVGDAWHGHGVLWSADGLGLSSLLRRIVAEVAEDRPFRQVAVRAAVELMVVEATRILVPSAAGAARAPRHPEVDRAHQLLDDEYATPWTVETLAIACGTSRTRLARLFNAEVGQPPYRYLLERRVDRAAELLATTPYSVAEVAAMVGFSSHVQLARHFRQLRGASPTTWRRSVLEPAPRAATAEDRAH
jgi:AraC-like DNA-binding protein